jgi:peptide/nickel transport system substrate-binding protein
MTLPYALTIPLLQGIKEQAPQVVCELRTTNGSTNLLIKRDAPPFDNAELRRATAFALDRKSFIDILSAGQGKIGGAMLPPPEGLWGLPGELLEQLPGYGPDVAKNRDEARRIMQQLGYGPEKRLAIKVAARNIANYRDPAVILIDQLKEIYIDGELDRVETANWLAKVTRKDYMVGLNLTGSAVDDPDQQFFENYACGSERNYTDYCNPELEKLFELQSRESAPDRRRQLVWEIDRQLQEYEARPIIYYARYATCWHSYVKGLTMMTNSIYNGWRFEDVWLDR